MMVVGHRPDGGSAALVRHPGDLLRLVVGRITLVASGVAAPAGQPGRLEENLFRLITDLPGILAAPFGAVMQLGSIAVVPLASSAALLFRRVRMAADIAVAGGLAWIFAGSVVRVPAATSRTAIAIHL
jgi:hypothetical protein